MTRGTSNPPPPSVESEGQTENQPKPKRRGRWKPGESGNPLTQFKPGNPGGPGRPKRVREIEDALLERFGEQIPLMVEFLLDGAHSGKIRLVQIVAIEKAMERIIGKARQRLEHTGANGGPVQVTGETSDEKRKRLAALTALAVARATGGTSDDPGHK